MAKFKKGDRVRDTEAMRDGVIVEVDAERPGYYAVKYDTRPQPQWNIPEEYLVAANSLASANAVVQNAINARRARNATVKIDDAEGAKRWDALWGKVAELKREAEALDKYLVSKKQYGYSAKLESLAKALTGF